MICDIVQYDIYIYIHMYYRYIYVYIYDIPPSPQTFRPDHPPLLQNKSKKGSIDQDQAQLTETWLDFAPPKKAVGPKAD